MGTQVSRNRRPLTPTLSLRRMRGDANEACLRRRERELIGSTGHFLSRVQVRKWNFRRMSDAKA